MHEVPSLIDFDLGYYDPLTGEVLKAVKAINITEDCSFDSDEHGHALLLFSQKDSRFGTLVQFRSTYNPDSPMGISRTFPLNDLQSSYLKSISYEWGLTENKLIDMAILNAPAD